MPKGKHKNHIRGEAHSWFRHGEVVYSDGRRIASPEYRAWQAAKNRCCNPQSKDWVYYGGRGIAFQWENFADFLADMGRRPSARHTLDRIDGNGPYCKANCRWATRQQQSRNRACVKLSPEKAAEIRRAIGRQVDIAARHGVSQTIVSLIKRGVAWKIGGE